MRRWRLLVLTLLLAGILQDACANDLETPFQESLLEYRLFTATQDDKRFSFISKLRFDQNPDGSYWEETAYAQLSEEAKNETGIHPFQNSGDTQRWAIVPLGTHAAVGTFDHAYTDVSPRPLSYNIGYKRRLELSPLGGYAVGGSINVEDSEDDLEISDSSFSGFRVAYDVSQNTQIEFYYSHQDTELTYDELFPSETFSDLDVDYYHIGGTYIWDREAWQPYITATAGLTHLSPDDSEFDSMNNFSLGIGGGVRFMPTDFFGLYLGGRGFATFVNSEAVGKSGSEGTRIAISSDVVWQFQFIAGGVIAF